MGGSPSKSGSRSNTLTVANGDMLVLSMVGRGLEALQAAVERLEGGKTFDPKIDASDRVSRIFQDPTEQSFAESEDPAKESATSH